MRYHRKSVVPEKIIVSEFPVLVEPRFDFRIFRVIVLQAPGRRALRPGRRQGSDPNQFSATTGLRGHSQLLAAASSGLQPCNEKKAKNVMKTVHTYSTSYYIQWNLYLWTLLNLPSKMYDRGYNRLMADTKNWYQN